MIYQMSRDLEANLRERLFPVEVMYTARRDPGRVPCSYTIVVERDTQQGDSVEPPRGATADPRQVRTRRLGVIATFYVSSPLDGARRQEHERVCDQLVDAWIVSLLEWVAQSRGLRDMVSFTEARYLADDEIDGAEVSASVVYRMRFTVPRAVAKKTYEGEGRPTTELLGVTSSTRVSLDGVNYEEV